MDLEEMAVSKFYDSRLFAFYRDSRFRVAVRIAALKPNEAILDFGCFRARLKKYLPKDTLYFGYDKNDKYSMGDWKTMKRIDAVFALAVLEHLTAPELEALILDFKSVGIKKIIAEFPFEDSPVNRFICWFFGSVFEHHITHVSGWRTITGILNRHYECSAYRNIFWSSWISVWQLRE